MRVFKSALAAVALTTLLLLSGLSAEAATFTFSSSDPGQGVFLNDNDVRLFPFTVTETFAQLTISTDSYLNEAFLGFDPTLALYTNTGAAATDLLVVGSISQNADPELGLGDDFVEVVVPAGNYLLALTQYDNTPFDADSDATTFLGEGFQFNNPVNPPEPDYTNPGGTERFVDLTGATRNGSFRVTVVTVAVPEASSAVLALPGLFALVGIAVRRRNMAKGN
ncbi:MAG: DVUA0089 family protein [Akkermansiaceae bacterium]|nr:DVUA0089 family protein [Armatimonadota bacterium]